VTETLKPVEDMIDDSPVVDVREQFEQFREILAELKAKIESRFELTRDPSTVELDSYGTNDGGRGSLEGYTGPEIDWMVHSWLGNPNASFANLHLTVWLGPQVKVPHLGIALLLWPEGWFYVDSVSRVNLMADGEYFDKYYEPVNEQWLADRANSEFVPFVSRAGFVRASLSPTAYCASFKNSDENRDVVRRVLNDHVDRWLQWVDEAEPVPAEERAALAETDLLMRRNIAERDPANVLGERLLGADLTNKLVRGLWGGDRELPRPGLS